MFWSLLSQTLYISVLPQRKSIEQPLRVDKNLVDVIFINSCGIQAKQNTFHLKIVGIEI